MVILYAQLAHGEPCLIYTSRLRSRSENICLNRDVIMRSDTCDFVKKTDLVSNQTENKS